MFGAGGREVDGLRPVDDDVRPAVGERNVLQADVEVRVGVPVRACGGVQGIGQEPGEPVVPLGRARAHDDHSVHDFDAGTLLLGPGVVLLRADLRMHPCGRHHLGGHDVYLLRGASTVPVLWAQPTVPRYRKPDPELRRRRRSAGRRPTSTCPACPGHPRGLPCPRADAPVGRQEREGAVSPGDGTPGGRQSGEVGPCAFCRPDRVL